MKDGAYKQGFPSQPSGGGGRKGCPEWLTPSPTEPVSHSKHLMGGGGKGGVDFPSGPRTNSRSFPPSMGLVIPIRDLVCLPVISCLKATPPALGMNAQWKKPLHQ